jgi:chromosome segregation ATPase
LKSGVGEGGELQYKIIHECFANLGKMTQHRIQLENDLRQQGQESAELIRKNAELASKIRFLEMRWEKRERKIKLHESQRKRHEMGKVRSAEEIIQNRVAEIRALEEGYKEKIEDLELSIRGYDAEIRQLEVENTALKKKKEELDTMAASNYQIFQEATICTTCYREKRTHVFQSCGHSLCEFCLSKWTTREQENDNLLTCIICEQRIQAVIEVDGFIVDRSFSPELPTL